jgi:hypothetical protein
LQPNGKENKTRNNVHRTEGEKNFSSRDCGEISPIGKFMHFSAVATPSREFFYWLVWQIKKVQQQRSNHQKFQPG